MNNVKNVFRYFSLLLLTTASLNANSECRSMIEDRLNSLSPSDSEGMPNLLEVLMLYIKSGEQMLDSCHRRNRCGIKGLEEGFADEFMFSVAASNDVRPMPKRLQDTLRGIAYDYDSCFKEQYVVGYTSRAGSAGKVQPPTGDGEKNKKSSKPMDECIVTSQRWSGDFYNAGSTNNCGVPLRVYACLVEPGHASSCKEGKYPAEGTGFIVHSSRQGDKGVINYMAGRDVNMNRKGSGLQLYWFACRDPDKPQRIAENRYKCVDFFAK